MLTKQNKDVWSDERVERLKALWAAGLSCSQIAHDFNCGFTRNAVIGKISRLGLPMRKSSDHTHKRAHPKRRTKFNFGTIATRSAPAADRDTYVHRETVVTPAEQRLIFDDLVDSRCKYPHGEQLPFSFCGAKSVPGLPYCESHARACYTQPAPQPRQVFREAAKEPPIRDKLDAVAEFAQ
jgi:GcrA cell cycle regulator